MNDRKELRFAELVIKPCSRVYGVAPCTASLGVTGTTKCYNSPRTCQDPANFLEGDEQVVRWAMPTEDLPSDIEAMPCIRNISRRPQVVDAGEGLGVRESVTVNMHNFLHNDDGFDPYPSDRTWNPYNRGTYWGKFSARWGNIDGKEFRTVDGYEGQSIDEMTRRHYIVESTAGPDASGNFSITGKDIIKLLDGDKAQWPLPSNGVLLASITDTDTSLTLDPSGIGSEYPASGTASIGDEKVTYTRSGDVITLTGRGLSGSNQDDHDAGETFQAAEVFTSQDPAAIFRDLLTWGTDVPSEYIDYATWKDEVDDFLGRLYSAEIMRPTPIRQLLEELVREAGLTVFTDLANKKIVLKVLRQETPIVEINDDFILAGSISSKKLSAKRISDVWVYYGKKNPLEKQGEQKNYAVVYAKPTANAVVALEGAPRAIRDVTSRWITVFNSSAAQSVADRLIARYENTPRKISLKIPNTYPLNLGAQATIESRIFEDSTGSLEEPINCQITQIDNADGIYSAIFEEVIFGQVEPPNPTLRIIQINSDTLNVNLRTAHDSIYSGITTGQTVRLIISSGVKIGSSSSSPALDIGSWPSGVTVEIGGTGRIQGIGGYTTIAGTALYTRYAVDIIDDIEIWGGGGQGGKGTVLGGIPPVLQYDLVGGAGAGYLAPGGATTEVGESTTYPVGSGGDPGQSGSDGYVIINDIEQSTNPGKSPGDAIDGVSYVTLTGAPDIRGPQVN